MTPAELAAMGLRVKPLTVRDYGQGDRFLVTGLGYTDIVTDQDGLTAAEADHAARVAAKIEGIEE